MKKLIYLIILALILGLVLTGCLLSNVGQVPTNEQSGIAYLTKGPLSADLVDLVGLWHFDDNADDSSASGNTGTLVNDPQWVLGRFGMALSFNGVDEYVDFGAAVDNSITTGITLEAWIKYSYADRNRNGGIISNDLTWITKKGYDFFLEGGKLGIDVGNGGSVGRVLYTMPAPDLTDPVWRHVAATWDGSTVRLYVDGAEVGTAASLSGTYSDPDKATWVGRINSHLSAYLYPFRGAIDEVRIWDGALTADQIEDSANHGIVIQKGMSQDDLALGDHVNITLEVVTVVPVTVVDTLPSELRYILGTFEVDSVPDTPSVVGQAISYTLLSPCAYTITFDAQVTSAEATSKTVTNNATAGGASASAALTIHPYEGFEKEVTVEHEAIEDGKITVGELVQWNMTITVPNNFDWEIINATLSDRLGGELGMAGDEVDNNLSGEIDEEVPGDLGSMYNNIPSGTLDIKVRGKANKVQFEITGISIPISENPDFVLGIFTDKNPAGKQSYSTDGTYELNSGAVLKFIDPGTGFQLSAHTPQITVVVEQPN